MDMIDRQAVKDVFVKLQQACFANGHLDEWFFLVQVAKEVNEIPSAEPEEAIPVAWLEEQAKWFDSMDHAFAKIEASSIRVMIKKWRGEKDKRPD